MFGTNLCDKYALRTRRSFYRLGGAHAGQYVCGFPDRHQRTILCQLKMTVTESGTRSLDALCALLRGGGSIAIHGAEPPCSSPPHVKTDAALSGGVGGATTRTPPMGECCQPPLTGRSRRASHRRRRWGSPTEARSRPTARRRTPPPQYCRSGPCLPGRRRGRSGVVGQTGGCPHFPPASGRRCIRSLPWAGHLA